jgi:threonine/homoserine efflux transporter RhtA
MYISMETVEPLLAILAGIICLVQPRLAIYIVGIYLIVIGVLGILPYLS